MINKNATELKHILEQPPFKLKVVSLKELNTGGNSQNYVCICPQHKYLIKLLPQDDFLRAQKLADILRCCAKQKSINTAHLMFDGNPPYFKIDKYIGLILNFIDGRKVKLSDFNAPRIKSIAATFLSLGRETSLFAPFAQERRLPQDCFQNNVTSLNRLSRESVNLWCLNRIARLNQDIFNQIPTLDKPAVLIHGDASLNNMLYREEQLALLDLELIRFGYPVEDIAELIMTAFFKHQILFFPKRKILRILKLFTACTGFSKQDWQYGIGLHYLDFIARRLRNLKSLKSLRRNLIFIRRLSMYKDIYRLLDELY